MKIIDVAQGSPEWLAARAGIPTASEFDCIVTPLWKARTGDGVETYLAKKLAERWTGMPLMTYRSAAMEQGSMTEEEARSFFEFTTNQEVTPVGFITTDDGRIGCSPDALLKVGGLELKCPEPHTHVRYLLRGGVPSEYVAQVHGSMLVTGAPRWTFMSYCREFPPLIVTVERHEPTIEAMRQAIDAFNERLDAAYELLVKLNGGMPNHRKPTDIKTLDFELAELL